MRIAVAGATGLVGRQVVEIASQRGHQTVPLARSLGVDLTTATDLDEVLAGAEALIDVTQSPTTDAVEASEFFTTVATNLGAAAHAAGVQRTVVLSIIGVDAMQDFDYYVAKLAQENAMRAHAPGTTVLRAAQFMEFPEQMLGRYREGDSVRVPAMPTQPVVVREVADLLLSMAEGDQSRDNVELAGPKAETLEDLVRRVAAHRGEKVTVTSAVYSEAMADGACLPGPDAILAGPDFATWLSAH